MLVLFAGGLLDTKKTVLFFSSGSEEFLYDGSAHNSGKWKLVEGSLPTGSSVSANFVGSRTDVGTSPNTFAVKIQNSEGNEITSDYDIKYQFGEITVKPLSISISTLSGHKVYDGTPLVCQEWEITSETGLIEGHTIQNVVMPAEITDVGVTENYISEIFVSDGKNNVTSNYNFNYHFGKLTVTLRNLTVRSGSAEKDYDGLPLTCEVWEIVSITKPVGGQQANVSVTGIRQEIGESENTISEVMIVSGGKDVTINYSITIQPGVLVVKGKSSGSITEGNGKLDTGGSIDGENENSNDVAVKVYSDIAEKVYLRLMSFGDYNGKNWGKAQDYSELLDGKYSLNYLTGIFLKNNGLESYKMQIDTMGGDYLLPYFMDTEALNYTVQTSDVWYKGNSNSVYGLYYFPYNYVSDGTVSADLGKYDNEEKAYSLFVHQNYSNVPSATLSYLKEIIAKEGFVKNDPDIIKKVAEYIQGAAKYNLAYNSQLDTENDIVISFLRDYREGVCSHYASAATLLYRALGIPARYTIGYASDVVSGEWTEIKGNKAHAWVEVYIEGMGWVQVEATGADNAEDPGTKETELSVKPVNEYMKYDGISTLTHSGKVQGLSNLLEKGYTYEAEVSGSRRDAGISLCTIVSFKLFNKSGEDVTSRFNITLSNGKLQVYLQEISVTTQSASKVYDGKALIESDCELSGKLIFGHTSVLKAVGSRTDVGRTINVFEIKITNADNKNVTEFYKINANYGVLEVLPLEITVVAGSATKTYDGSMLTCSDYQINFNTGDCAGINVKITVTGSQTEIGRSDNIVSACIIYDAEGNNVTFNFKIVLVNGVLIVTE